MRFDASFHDYPFGRFSLPSTTTSSCFAAAGNHLRRSGHRSSNMLHLRSSVVGGGCCAACRHTSYSHMLSRKVVSSRLSDPDLACQHVIISLAPSKLWAELLADASRSRHLHSHTMAQRYHANTSNRTALLRPQRPHFSSVTSSGSQGCWLAPLPFLGVESPCQGSACTSGGGGRRIPSERPLKLLRLQHRLPISIARPTAQLNLSMNFLCCYLVLRRSGLKV